MAWLGYVPYLLFFLWLLLTHYTLKAMREPKWVARKGRKVDGATIPEPLWALVGSPFTGDYRNASIIHDIAVEDAGTKRGRKAADRMYYYACRRGGCTKWQPSASVQRQNVRVLQIEATMSASGAICRVHLQRQRAALPT